MWLNISSKLESKPALFDLIFVIWKVRCIYLMNNNNAYIIKEQAFGEEPVSVTHNVSTFWGRSLFMSKGEELIYFTMRTRCDWSVESLPKHAQTNHHQMSSPWWRNLWWRNNQHHHQMSIASLWWRNLQVR